MTADQLQPTPLRDRYSHAVRNGPISQAVSETLQVNGVPPVYSLAAIGYVDGLNNELIDSFQGSGSESISITPSSRAEQIIDAFEQIIENNDTAGVVQLLYVDAIPVISELRSLIHEATPPIKKVPKKESGSGIADDFVDTFTLTRFVDFTPQSLAEWTEHVAISRSESDGTDSPRDIIPASNRLLALAVDLIDYANILEGNAIEYGGDVLQEHEITDRMRKTATFLKPLSVFQKAAENAAQVAA